MKIISKVNLITFLIIICFIDVGWLFLILSPTYDLKFKLIVTILFAIPNIILCAANREFGINVDNETIKIRTPKKSFGYNTTTIKLTDLSKTMIVNHEFMKIFKDTMYLICFIENGEEKGVVLYPYTRNDIKRLFEYLEKRHNIPNEVTTI